MRWNWKTTRRQWSCGAVLGVQLLAAPAIAQSDLSKVQQTRTWKDSTGVFVVQAELVELSPAAVKLRMSDGSTREVAREQLSADDQKFLKALEQSRSPFAKSVPMKDDGGKVLAPSAGADQPQPLTAKSLANQRLPAILPTLQNVIVYSPTTPLGSLETKHQEVPAVGLGEVYLTEIESGSRVSRLIPLDAESKLLAVGVSPSTYSTRSTQPSKIFIGTLPRGPFKQVVDLQDPFTLLDHYPLTGQSLACAGELGIAGDRELILLEGLEKGQPAQVSRFRLPVDDNGRGLVNQATLIEKDVAVVVYNNVMYAWNLKTGEQLYQTEPRRQVPGNIAFSADRSLMTVPSSLGINFADPKTGKDLGFFEFANAYRIDVTFDPKSNRIGYCSNDRWGIYDYQAKTSVRPEFVIVPIGDGIVGWFDKDFVVTSNGVVLDTQRQIPLWNYGSALWRNALVWDGSVTMVDPNQSLRLRTMELPHDALREVIQKLPEMKDLFVAQPGTKVAIAVDLPDPCPEGVDPSDLKKQLTQIVERTGWQLDEQAELKLVARIAPGKPFTDLYQPYTPGKANPERTKVEITPMISHLELKLGDKVVWHMQSQNNSPSPYGNSPYSQEDYIKNRQRALPEYYSSVNLPSRIVRPPNTYGFGQSHDNNGLWKEPLRRRQ